MCSARSRQNLVVVDGSVGVTMRLAMEDGSILMGAKLGIQPTRNDARETKDRRKKSRWKRRDEVLLRYLVGTPRVRLVVGPW